MAFLYICTCRMYRRGRDRLVVAFTTTCAITKVWVLRGVLDTILCNNVCQWLVAGRWFSPDTPGSSANKTDRHDITELLLKVALNTIKNLNQNKPMLTELQLMHNVIFDWSTFLRGPKFAWKRRETTRFRILWIVGPNVYVETWTMSLFLHDSFIHVTPEGTCV